MPSEKYSQRQRYDAWRRRTNKMILEKDPSGRPIPDSAINHMKTNPYPSIIKHEETNPYSTICKRREEDTATND